jgi:S1-C subfamily serine protease
MSTIYTNTWSHPETSPNNSLDQNNVSNYHETKKTLNQKNQKPKKSLGAKTSELFRNIGIIVVLILLIASSLIAWIIVEPESDFANYVINRTPVGRYFNFNGSSTETETQNNQQRPVNQFLGLDQSNNNDSNVVNIVESVLPSVLSIQVRNRQSRNFSFSSAGTGFVVSSEGLVLTNRHVVSLACSRATEASTIILAQDNQSNAFELEVLSIDPVDDIAILQIKNPPSDLKPVAFADSDQLRLGEQVITVGNVFGQLQNTVTQGIVSGLNRSLTSQGSDPCTNSSISADSLIQTDAAINKGNSGGPMFNSRGQLIGMNTFGSSEGQSIGFALPSNTLSLVLETYKQNGKITRPRLGIFSKPVLPIDKQERSWLPVDYGEILLAPEGQDAVADGSAAKRAGLQEGDIIVEINGQKIQANQQNPSPLRRILLRLKPNEEVTLRVYKARDFATNPTYPRAPQEIKLSLGSITFTSR